MEFKPSGNLAEQIAEYLGQQIVSGELAAGEPIAESRIAAQLQVSRGSVREAMLILERRHLVTIVPRRGAVVLMMREQEMQALYELRAVLTQALWTTLAQRWQTSYHQQLQPLLDAMARQIESPPTSGFSQTVGQFFDTAAALAGNHYLLQVLKNLEPASSKPLRELDGNRMSERRAMLQHCTALVEHASRAEIELAGRLVADWWRQQAPQPDERTTESACRQAA